MPDDAAPAKDRRWLLVAVVVAIPILVLVLVLAQRTWYPTGDQAQAELRMRSLPSHPPLVGAAGRIADEQQRQGNHPGPLMFWVTWPLYALLGRSSWAFEASTAIVNAIWLALSVWLVKRRAGLGACAWYGITALVLIGGYGLDGLSQPWNPWVALLPFTVLLLSTWSTLDGERWTPVLAVAAASYSLQGHVGYLPLVIPLVLVNLVWPIWRWLRLRRSSQASVAGDDEVGAAEHRPPASRWLVPVLVGIAVALVAWSGPFWDVATNHPSNVSKLIANFTNPTDPPLGLAQGAKAVLQAVNPVGAWVWGGSAVKGSVVPGLCLVAAWALVAGLVALRRGNRSLDRLNLVLAVVGLLGVVAVSRIFGTLYLYVFRWIVAIVALQVFALGWGLAILLPRPSPKAQQRLAGLAVVVLVVLSAVTAVRISRQEIPYDQSWRAEQVLAPAVAAKLDPSKRYLIRWDDPAYLGGLGFGLVLDLERRGLEVGADPRFSAAVEPHRVMCPGDHDAVVTVVTSRGTIARYEADPAYRKIASVDPREDPERWQRDFDALLAALHAEGNQISAADLERNMNLLLLAPGTSPKVRDLAAKVVLAGVPSAVFLQDPAPKEPPVAHTALTEPCWK